MASSKPIICTIKSPQLLSIGETEMQSGCATIDITFPNMNAVDIGSIAFRNNYTASLTILCKVKKTVKKEPHMSWKTALKRMKLMPNPHYETNSQNYFNIDSSKFRFSLDSICSVRFVLRQPSPCWKTFGLDEIKLFPPSLAQESSTAIPRWLLAGDELSATLGEEEPAPKDQARREGFPDPEEVSRTLHQMWSLTDYSTAASEATEQARVGRFDIDGCYEINLLSYN